VEAANGATTDCEERTVFKQLGLLGGAVAIACLATGSVLPAAGSSSDTGSDPDHLGWPVSSTQSPAAVVNAAHASAKRDDTKVLTVLEVVDLEEFVDVGEPGEGPGDVFLFENDLMNPAGTRIVGRDSGHCVIGIETFTCDATALIFGKGEIVVSSPTFNDNDIKFAITGGTGKFREAGGQLTVADAGNRNTLLIFQLTD
jgi:hypothetical protein